MTNRPLLRRVAALLVLVALCWEARAQAAEEAPAAPQPNATAPAPAGAAVRPGGSGGAGVRIGGLFTSWRAPKLYARTQATVFISRPRPEACIAVAGAGGLARGGVPPLAIAYVTQLGPLGANIGQLSGNLAYPFTSQLAADGRTLVVRLNPGFAPPPGPGGWYQQIRWPLGWAVTDSVLQTRGGVIYVRVRA